MSPHTSDHQTLNIKYGPILDASWFNEGGRYETAASLVRDLESRLQTGSYQREKTVYAMHAFRRLWVTMLDADYKTAAPYPGDDVFHPLELLVRPIYTMVEGDEKAIACLRESKTLLDAWHQLANGLDYLGKRLFLAVEAVGPSRARKSEAVQEAVDFALHYYPQDYLDHLRKWAEAGMAVTTIALTTKFAEPTNDTKVWLPPILELGCLPRLISAFPTYPFNMYRALKNRTYRRLVMSDLDRIQRKLGSITSRMTRILCSAMKS